MILGGYVSLVAFCFYLLHHLKKQARLLQVRNDRIIAYKKRLAKMRDIHTPVEEQGAREVAVETAKRIKQKLIREAIDCTLDLDFTQLNFDDIIDEVTTH